MHARGFIKKPSNRSLDGQSPPYRNSKEASHHEESHDRTMSEELRAAIGALQGGDDAHAQTETKPNQSTSLIASIFTPPVT